MYNHMKMSQMSAQTQWIAELSKQQEIANLLKMAELTENKYEKASYMRKARVLMRE